MVLATYRPALQDTASWGQAFSSGMQKQEEERKRKEAEDAAEKAKDDANSFNPMNALISAATAFVASGGNPIAAGIAGFTSKRGKDTDVVGSAVSGASSGLTGAMLNTGAPVGTGDLIGDTLNTGKNMLGNMGQAKNIPLTSSYLKQAMPGNDNVASLASMGETMYARQKEEDRIASSKKENDAALAIYDSKSPEELQKALGSYTGSEAGRAKVLSAYKTQDDALGKATAQNEYSVLLDKVKSVKTHEDYNKLKTEINSNTSVKDKKDELIKSLDTQIDSIKKNFEYSQSGKFENKIAMATTQAQLNQIARDLNSDQIKNKQPVISKILARSQQIKAEAKSADRERRRAADAAAAERRRADADGERRRAGGETTDIKEFNTKSEVLKIGAISGIAGITNEAKLRQGIISTKNEPRYNEIDRAQVLAAINKALRDL